MCDTYVSPDPTVAEISEMTALAATVDPQAGEHERRCEEPGDGKQPADDNTPKP